MSLNNQSVVEKEVPANEEHVRTLLLALERTKSLLNDDQITYEDIHKVKSIIYVAIERLGMKAEKVFYSQRLLRELFSIINTKADLRRYEKEAALQILEDLRARYRPEITNDASKPMV